MSTTRWLPLRVPRTNGDAPRLHSEAKSSPAPRECSWSASPSWPRSSQEMGKVLVDSGYDVQGAMLRRRLTVSSALIEAAREPPRLGQPKTAASERTITLPNIVIKTLALHLQQQPPIDGMVWTTERGAFLRRGSFSRIWRRAVAASVGQPCRVHDLRHTHAAWLIAAGEHPKTIQIRLGHSSIQVTMDRYGHLMEGSRRQNRRPSRCHCGELERPRSGPNRKRRD
jgi:hypothetical protein